LDIGTHIVLVVVIIGITGDILALLTQMNE